MPNTEQDYLVQIQEYQRQKLPLWDKLLVFALGLALLLVLLALSAVAT